VRPGSERVVTEISAIPPAAPGSTESHAMGRHGRDVGERVGRIGSFRGGVREAGTERGSAARVVVHRHDQHIAAFAGRLPGDVGALRSVDFGELLAILPDEGRRHADAGPESADAGAAGRGDSGNRRV